MNWHYVNQGQQVGPVTEEQLLALVREGKIPEDTLVWREGMQNWTAFHQADVSIPRPNPPPPAQPPPPANPNETLCAECGKIFPIDETIPYGNVRVCAACKPVFLQKLTEGAKINAPIGELNYAGFWIRCGAKIIDILVLAIPFWVVMAVVMMASASSTPGRTGPGTAPLSIVLVMLLELGFAAAHFGYQIFFLGKYGATLGKMMCRLRVVSSDGTRIGYGRATGRAFAELLSAWTCYIGYLIVLFDNPQRRALHDHICSTRVVHR